MDMAGVVVAVCADYDPMYGSEVWGCADTAVHEDAPAKARTRGATPDS